MNCRKCGKPIQIIERVVFRKVILDAEALEIIADPEGEEFVRIDGSKVRGKEADIGIIQQKTEWAYRMHRKTCGVEE